MHSVVIQTAWALKRQAEGALDSRNRLVRGNKKPEVRLKTRTEDTAVTEIRGGNLK